MARGGVRAPQIKSTPEGVPTQERRKQNIDIEWVGGELNPTKHHATL